MTAPAVSVITIFLDAAPFLAEAVDSVRGQTRGDFELLLVDDGSRDGSSEIARAYAARDPRIRYLEHAGHANLGMSASRNAGLAAARADLIAFVDADDVWLPEKLERQIALLSSSPRAAMVYGPAHYWHAEAGARGDDPRDFVQDVRVAPGALSEPPALAATYLAGPEATPSPSGILVRRAALDRVGGFETRFRGMYEDQALYLKLALAEPILVAGEGWYRYRQHDAACCAVAFRTGAHAGARRAFLAWAEGYVAARREPPREILRAIARERRRVEPPTGPRALARAVARTVLPEPARRWLRAHAP